MKTLAKLLALTLILGIFPALGGAEEVATTTVEAVETPDKAEIAEEGPSFTLTPQEEDGPEMLRFKASLRLLKHAQVTTKILLGCAAEPDAGKAMSGFKARNGNTLALLMRVISDNGGITQEIKDLLEEEVTIESAALFEGSDCLAFANLVAKNTRDIYKVPDLAEDYRLMRGPKASRR